jgi:hypothetical protein
MAWEMNPQRSAHSEKMSKGGSKPPMEKPEPKEPKEPKAEGGESGGDMSELHDHGDGTFHTMAGGMKTEHPHIGHALMHLAGHHSFNTQHMHIMHDGESHVTHHTMGGGAVEGPHQHPDVESLKNHVGQVMGGEEQPSAGGMMAHGAAAPMSPGLTGME